MPSRKLTTLTKEVAARQLSLLVVTETRQHEHEMQATAGQVMRLAKCEHAGLPGKVTDASGHTVWGVSMVWDPQRLRAVGSMTEIVPHRIIRGTFAVRRMWSERRRGRE